MQLKATLWRQTPPANRLKSSKDNRLATHVIRVEFVPVKDLIEPVKLFMTEGGVIMPYERLNMLILTDYSDSIDRILQIIHMLDNNYLDPDLVELVKINNNASADVAEDLKKIFGTGAKDAANRSFFYLFGSPQCAFCVGQFQTGSGERLKAGSNDLIPPRPRIFRHMSMRSRIQRRPISQ